MSKNNLFGIHEQIAATKETKGQKDEQKDEQKMKDVKGKRNRKTETDDIKGKRKRTGSGKLKSEPEQVDDSGFLDKFQARFSKPTIEDTHTRRTFLVRNDLLKQMDKLAKKQRKGFKTHLLNYALEKALEELEEDKK